METWKIVIIAAVMVVVIVGINLLKRKRVNDITVSMQAGDVENYKKLLFSKLSLYLLEPNMLFLMRADYHTIMGELDKSKKCLEVIQPKKLHFEAAMNYYQSMINLSFASKDITVFDAMIKGIESRKTEENNGFIEGVLENQRINRKLYFDFDSSVIQDLNSLLEEAVDDTKGMIYVNLGKAYHLNKEDKKAKEALNQAKVYLKDTPYEEVVNATIEDLKILD